MKIYQVEELVGITKKNIRFYEDEGLLCPERNPENGYRDYTMNDVQQLEKIKLLRKLSVPIEEIRFLQKGKISFSECMEKQVLLLEQERKNAELMMELCKKLGSEVTDLKNLKASEYLNEINNLEKQGTKFMDIEKEDINKKKKTGAIIAAIVFCAFMALILGTLIFAVREDRSALYPLLIAFVVVICAIIGTVVVLIQRMKEIEGGEEYDARNY
ncbi:MAG: MerR family transcriptional regulator [Treponema sp.]|nr:MerR family transcriptional regulator [Treponema sp.]